MSTMPRQDRENRVVDIFQTQEESEAMVVQGLLESAGIDTLLVGENAADVLPVGTFFLRATNEDAEEAKRVIEEYRANPAAEDQEPPAA